MREELSHDLTSSLNRLVHILGDNFWKLMPWVSLILMVMKGIDHYYVVLCYL